MTQKNPWDLVSLYELLYFNCPLCPYKNSSKQDFVNHACRVHPEARHYLKNIQDNSISDIHIPEYELIKTEFQHENEEAFASESDRPVKVEHYNIKSEFENDYVETEQFTYDNFVENEYGIYHEENEESFVKEDIDHEVKERKLEEKNFKCTICDKNYGTNAKLIGHLMKVHDEILKEYSEELVLFSYENDNVENDQFSQDARIEENGELKSDEKNFKCKVCNNIHTTKAKLIGHLVKAHDESIKAYFYKCNLCTKGFGYMEKLKTHLKKCHNEIEFKESLYTREDFKCEICQKSFINKTALYNHNKNIHPNDFDQQQHPCSFCDKIFKCKNTLYIHNRKFHTNWTCEWCEEKFDLRKNLKEHILSQHKEKSKEKLQCSSCGKSFGKLFNLKLHEDVVHKGIKNWPDACESKCEICGKSCSTKNSLKRHIRTVHEKIKDFICTKCGKSFTEKGSLQLHDKIHTGIRDFKCDQCDKTYKRSEHLKDHISAVHEGRRDYVCSTCGKGFVCSKNLRRHNANVHNGIKRPLPNINPFL